jgi:hypothetical protein
MLLMSSTNSCYRKGEKITCALCEARSWTVVGISLILASLITTGAQSGAQDKVEPHSEEGARSEEQREYSAGFLFLQTAGVGFKYSDSQNEQNPPQQTARTFASWSGLEWLFHGEPPQQIPLLREQLDPNPPESYSNGVSYLWAAASSLWRWQLLDLNVVLLWGGLKAPASYSLQGRYVRAYPHALSADNDTIQLFRERFEVTRPQSVSLYSLLSYRFFGKTSDLFWVRSAAIQKTRQLFEENRDAHALGGSFALNDVFTWSQKVESVTLLGVRFRRLYLPVIAPLEVADEEPSTSCTRRESAGGAVFATTTDGKPTLQWELVPTDVVEVILSSPAYQADSGRVSLFLERNSLVPLLKEIYAADGSLQKIVLSRGVLVQDKGTRNLFPLETIAFASLNRGSSDITVSQLLARTFRTCRATPQEFQPPFFSPVSKQPHRER